METQIIDDVMQQIVSKTMKHGEKIPSENELAAKYKVPRMTVRNALTKLEERGYIYSIQGKGRYLKEASTQIQLHLTGKTSFTDKMKEAGYDLKTENILCEMIAYNEQLFNKINANKEDSVYKIGRIRYINGEPIAIHYSYVSDKMFGEIEKDGPKIKSMFAYYRKLGYKEFASQKSLLSITFPTSEEQQLLFCKSMIPLIVVESECIDVASNEVLEHTKILYRSDKFKYDITMD
ncbi:GntR family transcriptional regulator [Psychrobacillus sp. OK032]|uniref:GntR family transcriptional regulator n=1 Tax=Psychrobacillus sp. OK032 TaxID=1884358 RepID=UPI002100F9D4|nr:GntR family transcriptional regulator [Psychrobacillus sp. OK032]